MKLMDNQDIDEINIVASDDKSENDSDIETVYSSDDDVPPPPDLDEDEVDD